MTITSAVAPVIAIIPARGGSKGIPGKNIKFLGGKPLIAHTIEAARKAETVQRVIVSTDDAEIAQISKQWGAEVILRPTEISGDLASSESALLHVLKVLAEHSQPQPELLVFLQCTSPFTSAEDIDGTVDALRRQQAQTALAVTEFHYFVWAEDAAGDIVGINHQKSVRLMRQQREKQYLETGAVYVMRVDGFLEHRHRFFGRTAMHIIPSERVHEIDEPADFALAEARLAQLQSQPGKG